MRVGSRIPTLCEFYTKLDNSFKRTIDDLIESNGHGSCLLRLLKVCDGMQGKDLYSINGLISVVMEKYAVIDERTAAYGFSFGIDDNPPIRMNPTLEDVLFLTGLPIIGNPVIPENSRDLDAFERVFGGELLGSLQIRADKQINMTSLQAIAVGTGHPTNKRIIAVLLLIIQCMIIPSHDGHVCPSSYVQFVENLADVNSYAWGAALLAFLYHGMNLYKAKGLKSIKGNTSMLVAFFIYHIPRLQVALGIQVMSVEPPTPLLTPVLKALRSICHNTKTISNKVNAIVSNLTDADICWRPYGSNMLRPELLQQLKYKTLMAPMFCYNVVVNHSPHLVAQQFSEFAGHNLGEQGTFLGLIRMKENSGSNPQDFKTYYAHERELWAKCRLGGTIQYVRRRYMTTLQQSQRTLQPPDHSHPQSSSQQPPHSSQPHHSNTQPPSTERIHHSSQQSPHSSPQPPNSSQPHHSNSQPPSTESIPHSSPQSPHHSRSQSPQHFSQQHNSPHHSHARSTSPQLNSPHHSHPRSSPRLEASRLAALLTPAAVGVRLRKCPDVLTYPSNQIPKRRHILRRKRKR